MKERFSEKVTKKSKKEKPSEVLETATFHAIAIKEADEAAENEEANNSHSDCTSDLHEEWILPSTP